MSHGEEYFIAADVTLYSNPLDMALSGAECANAIRCRENQEKQAENSHSKIPVLPQANEDAMVAADLTVYTSPMKELDQMHVVTKGNIANAVATHSRAK